MNALTVNGMSTTSALAAMTGLATGSVSHHIQVLSRAGVVERAEQGEDRRQRRWRLVTRGYHGSPAQFRDHPAGQATARAAMGVQVDRERDRARCSSRAPTRPGTTRRSRSLLAAADPAELVKFGNEIDELILRWRRREIPDYGAPDRLEVLAFARAFPSQP